MKDPVNNTFGSVAEYDFDIKTGTSRNQDNKNIAESYPWSSDNPYLEALRSTENKKNLRSYLQAALSWEEARGNQLFTQQMQLELMQLERQWALEDRSHDEEYNSPYQQALRQRAAGVNPDLQGVDNVPTQSQAVPQGAAPEQSSSPVQLPEVGEGYAVFAQIFGAVASGAASFASAGASLAALPGIFASNQVAQAVAQSQITEAENLAKISSENLSQSRVSTSLSKLSVIDQVARLIGSQVDDKGNPVDITSDAMYPVLSALGLNSDEDRALLDSYLQSSPVRSYVADQALSSRRSIAEGVVNTYDSVEEYAGVFSRVKLYQQYSEMYENEFMSRLNQYRSSSDSLYDAITAGFESDAELALSNNDLQLASNSALMQEGVPQLDAQSRASQARNIVSTLDSEAKAFASYIDNANSMIAKIDAEIEKFTFPNRKLVDADYQALNRLHALRSMYVVQTRSTMYQFSSQALITYQSLSRVAASYPGYARDGVSAYPNNRSVLNSAPKFYDIYWEPGMSGEESLSPLFDALGSLKFLK